jgi:predicted RNase H-like HicB family nuclease
MTRAVDPQPAALVTFNFWVVFKQSQEVKDQWVAHCLDLDVITQGNSLSHAVQMMSEAIGMTLVDDLQAGRNPTERRAPKEYWDEVFEIARRGKRVDFEPDAPVFADVNTLATVVTIELEKKTTKAAKKTPAVTQNRIAHIAPEVAFASCGV